MSIDAIARGHDLEVTIKLEPDALHVGFIMRAGSGRFVWGIDGSVVSSEDTFLEAEVACIAELESLE